MIRLRLSLILAVLTIVVSGPVFAQSTDVTDESPEAKFEKAPEGGGRFRGFDSDADLLTKYKQEGQ